MILSHSSKIAPHWRVIINSGLFLLSCILLVSIAEISRGLKVSQERHSYSMQSYEQAMSQYNDLAREYHDLTTADGLEYYVRNHYRAISAGEDLVVIVDPREKLIHKEVEPEKTWQEKIRLLLHIP